MGEQHEDATLDDQALISSLRKVLSFERRATASLVEHLAEFDTRGLYRDAGYSSLFTYCVEALQMSESESYARIHAARLSRRFPALLLLLRRGALNLTTLQLLGPKLDESNCDELCSAAAGLSKRKLEEMLAARFPQPDLSPTPAPRDGQQAAGQHGEPAYEIARPRLTAALASPEHGPRCLFVPSEKHSVVVGLKVYGIRQDSLPAEVGMRNGDLILRVNGESLVDPTVALRIYDAVPNTSRFTVEVLRGDQSLRFHYRVTDPD